MRKIDTISNFMMSWKTVKKKDRKGNALMALSIIAVEVLLTQLF